MNIPLVRILDGAVPFGVGNVNDTFRGFVLLPDGQQRHSIIKDLDETQLANELMAFLLAKLVGLPVPDAYVGIAFTEVIQPNSAPRTTDGSGIFFVSADVMQPNLTQRIADTTSAAGRAAIVERLVNWPDLGRLYAFDTWIANIDRHPGNLLLGGSGDFWLIDHGHAFTGPKWSPADLVANGEFANRLLEWLTKFLRLEQRQTRTTEITAFAAIINAIDVPNAVKNSLVEHFIPAPHIEAVKNFLQLRRNHVVPHASTALGLPRLVV